MKKLLFIILLLNISILSYSLNFSVSPTGFSVGLNKTSTHEITILNNTTEPLRLNAVFHSDPTFGEKYNLDSNLTIFPKTISLKPAAQQVIRFRVKPDSKLENGEYKSLLTFTEIPAEIKTTAKNNETASNLKFITEINISVYGYKGNLTHKGTLSDVKLAYSGNSAVISAASFSEGQGSDAEASGLFGISAREGNKDLILSTQLGPNLKGKKAKLVITDQNGKVYYDKVHTL